jgi:hypothetical protein
MEQPEWMHCWLLNFGRPESLINSCIIEQGVSDHCGVLLEVEWEENYYRPEVEKLDPV